jgi:hypothetical protein
VGGTPVRAEGGGTGPVDEGGVCVGVAEAATGVTLGKLEAAVGVGATAAEAGEADATEGEETVT